MHTSTFLFLRICQYEGRDVLHTIKRNQTDWIGHIRCGNFPLNHLMEGKVEEQDKGMRRRRKRRKQLLIPFKAKQTMKIWKGEVLDRTLCRTYFGSGCGLVRQTMHYYYYYHHYYYNVSLLKLYYFVLRKINCLMNESIYKESLPFFIITNT